MNIRLLALGHKMPSWVDSAFNIYNQRLPTHLKIELIEISPVQRQKNKSSSQIKALEAEALSKYLLAGDLHIVLDEQGQLVTTKDIAKALDSWQMMGRNVNVIIGGADGLDHTIKQQAHQIWSLSRLTFPHQLVRVIIVEQIYRAYSLLINHPYHRE